MVGGGRAIAMATRPSRGGGCFLVSANVNCGLIRDSICTTWNIRFKSGKNTVYVSKGITYDKTEGGVRLLNNVCESSDNYVI